MKLKDLIKLYDNWSIPSKINDENLQTIVIEEPYELIKSEIWEKIKDYPVMAFGIYEFENTPEDEGREGQYLAIRIDTKEKDCTWVVHMQWRMDGFEDGGHKVLLFDFWEDAFKTFQESIEEEKKNSWWEDININVKLDDNGNYEDDDYFIEYKVLPKKKAYICVENKNYGHYTSISIYLKEVQ